MTKYITYTVHPDEVITYSELSVKMFGTPELADRILRSNRTKGVRKFPLDQIDPGSVIRIRKY